MIKNYFAFLSRWNHIAFFSKEYCHVYEMCVYYWPHCTDVTHNRVLRKFAKCVSQEKKIRKASCTCSSHLEGKADISVFASVIHPTLLYTHVRVSINTRYNGSCVRRAQSRIATDIHTYKRHPRTRIRARRRTAANFCRTDAGSTG